MRCSNTRSVFGCNLKHILQAFIPNRVINPRECALQLTQIRSPFKSSFSVEYLLIDVDDTLERKPNQLHYMSANFANVFL